MKINEDSSYRLYKKKMIPTDGGSVLHILKKTDPSFLSFGEVYCSEITRGSLRPWKKHTKMTSNIVVVSGDVSFELTKDFERYDELTIGRSNYYLLMIPPGIWFRFRGLGDSNIVINVASIEHQENELIRMSEKIKK